jgi:hypothetical protein
MNLPGRSRKLKEIEVEFSSVFGNYIKTHSSADVNFSITILTASFGTYQYTQCSSIFLFYIYRLLKIFRAA